MSNTPDRKLIRKNGGKVDKLFYSREEAAYTFSTSTDTIDRMVAQKLMTTRRLGRRVLIPAADIRAVERMINSDQLTNLAVA